MNYDPSLTKLEISRGGKGLFLHVWDASPAAKHCPVTLEQLLDLKRQIDEVIRWEK